MKIILIAGLQLTKLFLIRDGLMDWPCMQYKIVFWYGIVAQKYTAGMLNDDNLFVYTNILIFCVKVNSVTFQNEIQIYL